MSTNTLPIPAAPRFAPVYLNPVGGHAVYCDGELFMYRLTCEQAKAIATACNKKKQNNGRPAA